MPDWALSVSQLNEYVRRLLAGDQVLAHVSVRGELSGFKRHYSGHLYFSIKDDKARVQAVMFRSAALSLDFAPQDGQMVVCSGQASLFARDGSFQIYVDSMRAQGAGALYEQFEKRKALLQREGLFDASVKQELAYLPRRVGIVTSRSGAALRDMLRVIRRRFPRMDIVLCAASVQGAGAAKEIADAIGRMNRARAADVLLVGRGGGSIEDLWAFNEEIVARAIFASTIPVVSCVGHETDFTIADFVADQRAATPSMAAELAVPEYVRERRALSGLLGRMMRAQRARLAKCRDRLSRIGATPGMMNPVRRLRERKIALSRLEERMTRGMITYLSNLRGTLTRTQRALTALGPNAVIGRGYAVVTDLEQAPVPRAAMLAAGQEIWIRFADGRVAARVARIDRKDVHNGGEPGRAL